MLTARVSSWFATILLHQRLDKFSLFDTEHVCCCLEAVIFGIGDSLRSTALSETEKNQKLGIGRSSPKYDGSDRPIQPNETHSMNHASDVHRRSWEFFLDAFR